MKTGLPAGSLSIAEKSGTGLKPRHPDRQSRHRHTPDQSNASDKRPQTHKVASLDDRADGADLQGQARRVLVHSCVNRRNEGHFLTIGCFAYLAKLHRITEKMRSTSEGRIATLNRNARLRFRAEMPSSDLPAFR